MKINAALWTYIAWEVEKGLLFYKGRYKLQAVVKCKIRGGERYIQVWAATMDVPFIIIKFICLKTFVTE